MKIKGLTLEQIKQAAAEAGRFELQNVRQIGNYTFFVLRMEPRAGRPCNMEHESEGSPRYLCTRDVGHEGDHIARADSHGKILARWPNRGEVHPLMKFRKRGISYEMWGRGPRYGAAVCFHGFKEFMDRVFDLNPQAIIRTAKAAYLGREDFERKYPEVETQNVGSQMCPVMYGECCDC